MLVGNTPQLDNLQGLALEYARWKGWRDKVYGRMHPLRSHRIAAWARLGREYKGRMVYTEGPQRGELFHRAPGHFLGAHADCSQYAATCAHWAGSVKVDAADWTGSLWDKCRPLANPSIGAGVIFGPHPGVHMGILTGKLSGEWVVTGFGDQSGPDANSLTGLGAYFTGRNEPGVHYISLT